MIKSRQRSNAPGASTCHQVSPLIASTYSLFEHVLLMEIEWTPCPLHQCISSNAPGYVVRCATTCRPFTIPLKFPFRARVKSVIGGLRDQAMDASRFHPMLAVMPHYLHVEDMWEHSPTWKKKMGDGEFKSCGAVTHLSFCPKLLTRAH